MAAFLKAQKIVDEDPILRFDPFYVQTARKVNMLQHAKKFIEYHKHFDFNYEMKNKEVIFFSEQMPLTLHFYMFLITLTNLCSERQV